MRQSVRRLALLLITLAFSKSAMAQTSGADCQSELLAAEARYQLPPGLLLSMAKVETGRPDPLTGKITPWPWTIQAEGQGYFYATAGEAVRGAKALLKAGQSFVDVGCLQVDLHHHPDAFRTLDSAFDPATNVDYAAHYLSGLAKARGSWLEAVAAYNAGDPAHGLDYLAKVLYQWKGVRLPLPAAPHRQPAFIITVP